MPDIPGKSFCIMRVVGEPVDAFLLHAAARRAVHAPHQHLQIHTQRAARQIANAAALLIVPRATDRATRAARRFFSRRVRRTMRPSLSALQRATTRCGVHPGTRYASRSSLPPSKVSMHELMDGRDPRQPPLLLSKSATSTRELRRIYPHIPRKSRKNESAGFLYGTKNGDDLTIVITSTGVKTSVQISFLDRR